MNDLPDVDVWVALSVEDHPAHAAAVSYWLHETPEKLCFCRQSMLGLIRVTSRSNTLGGIPLTVSEALALYRSWLGQPGIGYCPEPEAIENSLATLIQSGVVSARILTHAYLASFAIAAGMRLVSFDSDYFRFPGLDFLHLRP